MTAAIALRRRDEGKANLAGQMLYYPEARLPFDTPAATENNTGLYLECNGIFSFADHYAPRGVAPGFKYISPGMQSLEYLKGTYSCSPENFAADIVQINLLLASSRAALIH